MPGTLTRFSPFTSSLSKEHRTAEQVFKEKKKHLEHLDENDYALMLSADDFFHDNVGLVSVNSITPLCITPYHNHDFFEINYVLSGSCAEYVEGKNIVLNEGELLFLHPDTFHAACPIGGSTALNILLRASLIETLEKRLHKCTANNYLARLLQKKAYIRFPRPDSSVVKSCIERMIQAVGRAKADKAFNLHAELLAGELLVCLSECYRPDMLYTIGTHAVGSDHMDRILEYVRDNLTIITLESTASHFGYTGAHLSRLIKKHTGFTFSAFVINQRMLAAEKMLSETAVPISAIPSMIGLESREYFDRLFKKCHGITPSEYRRKTVKR